jgi:hypothetical protein
MARVGNDATGHISCNETHDIGHLHPERMIAAERPHWHVQFAAGTGGLE